MNFRATVMGVSLSTLSALMSSTVSAGLINWNGNGHDYQLITGKLTWEQANAQLSDGWYLATITSAEEQAFIESAFGNFRGEYWLGGFQMEQGLTAAQRASGAAQNWHWVTGEAFESFENWKLSEPNEWRGALENHLGIWNNGSSWDWEWNDEHGNSNITGYIAERGTYKVPEPSSIVLLGLGVIGLTLSRKLTKRQ